jgi:hypothetical protein
MEGGVYKHRTGYRNIGIIVNAFESQGYDYVAFARITASVFS